MAATTLVGLARYLIEVGQSIGPLNGSPAKKRPEICGLVGEMQDNFPTLTWRCQALERCAKILQREYGVNLRPQLGH